MLTYDIVRIYCIATVVFRILHFSRLAFTQMPKPVDIPRNTWILETPTVVAFLNANTWLIYAFKCEFRDGDRDRSLIPRGEFFILGDGDENVSFPTQM